MTQILKQGFSYAVTGKTHHVFNSTPTVRSPSPITEIVESTAKTEYDSDTVASCTWTPKYKTTHNEKADCPHPKKAELKARTSLSTSRRKRLPESN